MMTPSAGLPDTVAASRGEVPGERRRAGPVLAALLASAAAVAACIVVGSSPLREDVLPGEESGMFAVREWNEDRWFPQLEVVSEGVAAKVVEELRGKDRATPLAAEVELQVRASSDPMGKKDDPRSTFHVVCRSPAEWVLTTSPAPPAGAPAGAGASSPASGEGALEKGRLGDELWTVVPWLRRGVSLPAAAGADAGDPLRPPLELLDVRYLAGLDEDGTRAVFAFRPGIESIEEVVVWVDRASGLAARTLTTVRRPKEEKLLVKQQLRLPDADAAAAVATPAIHRPANLLGLGADAVPGMAFHSGHVHRRK